MKIDVTERYDCGNPTAIRCQNIIMPGFPSPSSHATLTLKVGDILLVREGHYDNVKYVAVVKFDEIKNNIGALKQVDIITTDAQQVISCSVDFDAVNKWFEILDVRQATALLNHLASLQNRVLEGATRIVNLLK